MVLEWPYCIAQWNSGLTSLFDAAAGQRTPADDMTAALSSVVLVRERVRPDRRHRHCDFALPIAVAQNFCDYCLNFRIILVISSEQIKTVSLQINILFTVTNIYCRLGCNSVTMTLCRLLFCFGGLIFS